MLLDIPLINATAIPTPDAAGQVNVDIDQLEREPGVARRLALMTLAGAIDEEGWPPAWPSPDGATSDERTLAATARYLKLDQGGWDELVAEARRLSTEPEFGRIERAVALCWSEASSSMSAT